MLRLAGVKSYSTASSLTSQSDGSQWPRFGLLLRRAGLIGQGADQLLPAPGANPNHPWKPFARFAISARKSDTKLSEEFVSN
jgi:hypothetical protein